MNAPAKPAKPGKAGKSKPAHMSYEQHLDEVATLLTEIYTLEDAAAIDIVMRAQDAEYFSGHDDDPTICTQERAEADARYVFKHFRAPKGGKPAPGR